MQTDHDPAVLHVRCRDVRCDDELGAIAGALRIRRGRGLHRGDVMRRTTGGVSGGMAWPVGQPAVIADFDPPDRPWLSGHRGVDLQASDGDELYAPADGIISFAGSVGGKSVVSVNHGDLVSTFEPAHTEGVAGTAVRRGDVIGEVGGASDHCDGRCLHWGVRRVRLQNEGTATTYLDPLARVRPMRIGLKPD